MSGEEGISKGKENRLRQKEKIDAETQRSLAVAEMKKAHKIIEETEKSRKRPVILSICHRIEHHIVVLEGYRKMFGKPAFAMEKILFEPLLENIKYFVETYESIRIDFQKNLEIKSEEMSILFASIKIDTTSGLGVQATFSRMIQQLIQMRLYCERIIV